MMKFRQHLIIGVVYSGCSVRDFLFDVDLVDLENFQPLVRFKVQKFAEVTKLLGWKCVLLCAADSSR
jgi:hypothetical protein